MRSRRAASLSSAAAASIARRARVSASSASQALIFSVGPACEGGGGGTACKRTTGRARARAARVRKRMHSRQKRTGSSCRATFWPVGCTLSCFTPDWKRFAEAAEVEAAGVHDAGRLHSMTPFMRPSALPPPPALPSPSAMFRAQYEAQVCARRRTRAPPPRVQNACVTTVRPAIAR